MSEDADAGRQRRLALVAEVIADTGIDEAMIAALVNGFYERARRDELLGPVFASRVSNWEAHLARMRDFWSSVTLMSGRYHGQPMVAHASLPIDPAHFERWVELFARTAREVCPPAAAAYFIERAERIADSLEMGIAARRGEIRGPRFRPPPRLREVPTERDAQAVPGDAQPRRY